MLKPLVFLKASTRTLLRAVCVLLCASSTSFLLMDMLPGDAATVMTRTANEAQIQAARVQLGLDRPLATRLWDWFSRLFFHGDSGELYASHMTVWEASAVSAKNSVLLIACAFPLLLSIGVSLGILSGLTPNSWCDRLGSTGAQITIATPDFAVTTVVLILLAGVIGIAPAVSLVPPGGSPLDRPQALLVPALSIALVGGAWLQRMVRAAIVDAAALPHVRALTWAGMHPVLVALRHTIPAAAAPIFQACAATVPYVVTGTVVVENVVGFPGIGTLIASLISARETPAVASLTAVFAAITVTSFTLADTLNNRINNNAQSDFHD